MINNFIKYVALLITLFIGPNELHAQQKKYLPLPDGTFLELKEGQSSREAWLKAQTAYPEAFGLKSIDDDKKMDIDWFNECRTRVAKEAKTDTALFHMLQSCSQQAVPQRCRAYSIKSDALGNETGQERVKCIEECSRANYYSKTFGECKKG
jgi:hypothetical protein